MLLLGLYADELTYYAAEPKEAAALLSIGETQPAENSNAAEAAAMTMVCRTILNLDATIWKR